MHIAEATELIWIDKISRDRAQTMVRSRLRDRHIYARPCNVAVPRQRHPCHRQKRKIVVADSRPVSRSDNPQGGCGPARERSLFARARWRAHGQFSAFHRIPRGFPCEATVPVRAIAGCRIRRQGAKSMGTIPTRLLCLARLAPGTRI